MTPQEYLRYQDEQMHDYYERLERESILNKAEEAAEKKAQAKGLPDGYEKFKLYSRAHE